MLHDYQSRSQVLPSDSNFAGYRIESLIGHGGMATVYRARELRLDRVVALKILMPDAVADPMFRTRFIRETMAIARIDDPHIVPVFDAGEADGVLYLAMRYIKGGDAHTLLREAGPLLAGRVAEIISPVASALDSAHALDFVHRDVKPANILVDRRPGRPDYAYLSDFGLCKGNPASTSLTKSGMFVGTPGYIAPEQITADHVDGRADQYALACTTYELLTGSMPFARDDAYSQIRAHLNAPRPDVASERRDLPPVAGQIIAKAMARRPEDRFSTCGEFASTLRRSLELPGHAPTEVVQPAVRQLAPASTIDKIPRQQRAAAGADPTAMDQQRAAAEVKRGRAKSGSSRWISRLALPAVALVCLATLVALDLNALNQPMVDALILAITAVVSATYKAAEIAGRWLWRRSRPAARDVPGER